MPHLDADEPVPFRPSTAASTVSKKQNKGFLSELISIPGQIVNDIANELNKPKKKPEPYQPPESVRKMQQELEQLENERILNEKQKEIENEWDQPCEEEGKNQAIEPVTVGKENIETLIPNPYKKKKVEPEVKPEDIEICQKSPNKAPEMMNSSVSKFFKPPQVGEIEASAKPEKPEENYHEFAQDVISGTVRGLLIPATLTGQLVRNIYTANSNYKKR